MNAQDLRNSILQLAIQGKLVEQREEEGTAKELIEEINAEKERLIKEKKIKKEKPLAEITEDEVPFEIPESWEWVRFGEIINIVSARRVHQADWRTSGIPFYRAREIAKLADTGRVKNELFIDKELFNEFSKSGVPSAGDLMVTAVGTLGKSYIVKNNDKFYYKDASVICLENYGNLVSEYLQIVLDSEMMKKQIRSNSGGTTVATLTMVRMNMYCLPIPPLAEQKRIVAKIEELMPYIEKYGDAYSKLEVFNKNFPEDMQKSILQYAIQGKLVEQREEEGTAEELYKQIQEEKEKLIKEKKIKKEKPLSEITENEVPFEIPESWKWVRLLDVCEYIQRGKSPKYSDIQKYPVVAQKCNQWSGFSIEKAKFIDPDTINKYTPERFLRDGDLMWNSTGLGTLGRMAIYYAALNPYELAVADSHVTVIRALKEFISYRYLYYYFANPSVQNVIEKQSDGSTKQKELATSTIKSYVVPLPPLEEQKRIVAKIEEMLPYCQQLVK